MDNGASSYRRFLDGDKNAIDEIMEELFFSLVFFLDRYVHDVHTAEDLAMDTITDLLVHRHRYNFKVSLKTYVFLLGKSRALNYLRQRNRHPTLELHEAEAAEAEEDELETKVLDAERKRVVNAALARLPEDMRIAVHLVFFEDLSYEEAARVMGKNKKQVDNLLYRAKNQLRTILGAEGVELL